MIEMSVYFVEEKRQKKRPFDDHFALIILIFLYIDNFCGGLRIFV